RPPSTEVAPVLTTGRNACGRRGPPGGDLEYGGRPTGLTALCRGSVRRNPENLTGDAVAVVAEQVGDDVCDPVGYARPVDRERHRVDTDIALVQFQRERSREQGILR